MAIHLHKPARRPDERTEKELPTSNIQHPTSNAEPRTAGSPKAAPFTPALTPQRGEGEYHPPTREIVAGKKPKLRKLRNLFRKREL